MFHRGVSRSDDVIVGALTKAGLLSHFFLDDTHFGEETTTAINISGFGEHPILDRKISQFQELSVGQCQLFALCRALVKVSSLRSSGMKPVIVLDEVTSSLDSAAESNIHSIIDDEFTENGHTVIIVAHRLSVLKKHTKSGRDALVMMADGRLQEVIENIEPATFQGFERME